MDYVNEELWRNRPTPCAGNETETDPIPGIYESVDLRIGIYPPTVRDADPLDPEDPEECEKWTAIIQLALPAVPVKTDGMTNSLSQSNKTAPHNVVEAHLDPRFLHGTGPTVLYDQLRPTWGVPGNETQTIHVPSLQDPDETVEVEVPTTRVREVLIRRTNPVCLLDEVLRITDEVLIKLREVQDRKQFYRKLNTIKQEREG